MILVTGSAREVGATLVRHLRAAGHDVLGSDIERSSDIDAISSDLRLEEDVHRYLQVVSSP
jgi:nucleoside-diphosphate-sugar epimerase